ncbi:MAG: hypothetical protein KGL39_45520, partial [Patescibacteria group bacterium]|nr:hypothetical protein [Patescibacteria group bacterium]
MPAGFTFEEAQGAAPSGGFSFEEAQGTPKAFSFEEAQSAAPTPNSRQRNALEDVPENGLELGARNGLLEQQAQKWLKTLPPGPGAIRPAPSTYEQIVRAIGSRLPLTGIEPNESVAPPKVEGGGAPPESPAAMLELPADVANFAGKAAQAGLGDIASAMRGEAGGNIQALLDREKLPVQTAVEESAKEDREHHQLGYSTLAADISLGLADLAPKIVVMEAAPEAKLLKAGAAAGVFGFDEKGKFDTRQAAFAAAFPYITEGTANVADAAIKKAVDRGFTWAGSPAAQRAIHVAANQAAMDAVMLAQQSPELMQLAGSDPEEFKRQVAKTLASNLAFAIPEAMQAREPVTGEQKTETSEQPAAAGEQAAQSDQLVTETPTKELARINDRLDQIEQQHGPRDTLDPESRKFQPARILTSEERQLLARREELNRQLDEESKVSTAAREPGTDLIEAIRKQGTQKAAPAELNQDMAAQLQAIMTGNQVKPNEEPAQPGTSTAAQTEPVTLPNDVESQIEEALQAEPQKGAEGAEGTDLTPSAEGATTGLAAPETETGGTGSTSETLETPAEATPAEKAAPPATESGTIPVEAGETPARSAAASRTGGTDKRPWDLIDEAEASIGHIDPTLIKEANPNWKPTGAARKLFKKGGVPADVAADALARSGHYKGDAGQVDQFGEALNGSARSRVSARQRTARENKQLTQDSAFARDSARPGPGQRTVISDDLQPGDTLKIRGAPFKVRELEFDDDGMVVGVTLDDGAKYGTQEVGGGVELQVDKKSLRKGKEPVVTGRTAEGTNRTRLAREGEEGVVPRSKFEAWLDQAIEATDPLTGSAVTTGRTPMGVAELPVWMTKTLANGTLRAVRAAIKGGRVIAEAIEDGLAWLKDQKPEGYNEDEARSWLQRAGGRDAVVRAMQRLREINERLGELMKQERRTGPLSPDERRERHGLRTQATQLMRALYTHQVYVSDMIHRLDALGTELQNARAAGNGAHARQLGEEFADISAAVEKNIPEQLFTRVFNEMVARGEIMRPQWKPSAKAQEALAAEEAGGQQPAAPGNRPIPSLEELERPPTVFERMSERGQELWKRLRLLRSKTVAHWRASPFRDQISYLKDSADNIAKIFGKQAANVVVHELNRGFGARTYDEVGRRDPLREMALTFAVEAGAGLEGGPGEGGQVPYGAGRNALQEFRERIISSDHRGSTWAKKALKAIRFADENWERLQPVARLYHELTEAQNATENENGIRTLHRSGGYVFHLQDVHEDFLLPDTTGGYTNSPQQPGEPFRRIRDYATYADSIAAGISPKSLSAIDLLQRRLSLGQKLIGYGGWVDAMRSIVDPTTDTPIVTEPEVRINAAGDTETTAPVGYSLINFAHRQVAL